MEQDIARRLYGIPLVEIGILFAENVPVRVVNVHLDSAMEEFKIYRMHDQLLYSLHSAL